VPRYQRAASRVHGHCPRARFPPGYLHDAVPGPLGDSRRLGDIAPASRCAHPRRTVHGRVGGGAVARPAPRVDRARTGAARSRGLVFPPDGADAVPSRGPAATEGLRTLPPRENGGNFDAKQLTKGSKLLLPVAVDGGLFSTGDGHFAQGDGEVCVTAVEMGATVGVRFRVLKGAAGSGAMRGPRFSHGGYFAPPEWAAPRGFVAAMGMPIRDDGVNDGENLTLACRNALLNMIDLLQDRGWSREQAYAICSVAVDLRVSNVVDVPNYVVSALLPEAIFTGC